MSNHVYNYDYDGQLDEKYLSYECPICGSSLICSKAAWEIHFSYFPESQAYCNGKFQDHITSEDEKEHMDKYHGGGYHSLTIMIISEE